MAGVQGRDGRGVRQDSSQVKLVCLKILQPWRGTRSPSQCLLLPVEHVNICASTGLGIPLAGSVGRGACYIRPILSE